MSGSPGFIKSVLFFLPEYISKRKMKVFAVIVPAAKLPELSLATTVLLVFVLVALTVHVTEPDPLKDAPDRYVPAYRLQATRVALDALPFSVAVITPAEKFPEPSLATIVLAVDWEVALTFHVTGSAPVNEDPLI